MLELINEEYLSDSFPVEWKESIVVPIPKANTETRDPSKYRPIALTCCLSKVMERMANRRLKEFLISNGLLDQRQHAFQQGCGTNTLFASLGAHLHDAHAKGLHTEIISLDLSKAYNRTWIPLVIRQLIEWKLSGHIVRFVQNFTNGRSFRVSVGDCYSQPFAEETGVPQGSVLAVTLFLVAMNGVFKNLPKDIHIFVYADDIFIVVSGPTPVRVRIKAQAAVNAISRWATASGFDLSAPKSIRCHVCPSNHRVSDVPITIQQQVIPCKKTVKILGVLVDRNLSFRQHFDTIKESCRTRLNLIRTISQPHRSNNRAIRFKVAQAIIDSRLTYGLELTCIASERLVTTLEPVYNEYIRTISGLLPSTPADSACAEAGLLPFRHLISAAICKKAGAYLERTSGDDRISLLDEVARILNTASNEELPPVARVHWLGDVSWQSTTPHIDSTIKNQFRAGDNSTILRSTVLEWLRTKYPNYEHRYTDGSLSARGIGMGISSPRISASFSLPIQCSVFSAEASAVSIAATTQSELPILILTDSASVISALQSEKPTHPWIQGILRYAPPSTVFAWIPGHCGIPGNTTADQLAGSGYSSPRYTDEIPLDDFKRWVSQSLKERWNREWNVQDTQFLRRIKQSTNRWKDLSQLREQRIVSRLRTGHTRLSHNMSGVGPFRKICEICGIQNTVEHFICVCPVYEIHRNTHGISGSIRDVLGDNVTSLTSLLSFLKDADIYNKI